MSVPQNYPRIEDEEDHYYGYLDPDTLVPHQTKISSERLVHIITNAIVSANRKSGREVLAINEEMSDEEILQTYAAAGRRLFSYFRKYVSDPADFAYQIFNKSYHEVGTELFRRQTLQKERMNSGWRYQFLAVDAARESQRFISVSDIGAAEADFNAVIAFKDQERHPIPLSLYVSVKNRSDTVGGQDYPKAVNALEEYARSDRNRRGPYCGVMGIVMESGERRMRKTRSGDYHSINVEMWLSDFFWPFFTNFSYKEIMLAVLDVLMSAHEPDELSPDIMIPESVLDAFRAECEKAELLDENGIFNNPAKLVEFFVS